MRLNELMLKSDFDSKPVSKITKVIGKAMNKMGIRDAPSSGSGGVRVQTGTGNNTSSPAGNPVSDPSAYDIIYPFSVGN